MSFFVMIPNVFEKQLTWFINLDGDLMMELFTYMMKNPEKS